MACLTCLLLLKHQPLPLPRRSAHLLRMDASGHIQPDFFPFYQNETKVTSWLQCHCACMPPHAHAVPAKSASMHTTCPCLRSSSAAVAGKHNQGPSRPAVPSPMQMPLWLETINDPWDYEQARQGANYSYQSFALYKWVHIACRLCPATVASY